MPIDFIHNANGRVNAYGDVASRLLATNGDLSQLRTNDLLLYDEWKEIDKAVLMAAQERLTGIADLESRGLVYNLGSGLGTTVLAYQDASDINAAELTMDGVTQGDRDRPSYSINYIPLPIAFKDFSFSLRNILESRKGNRPLDTTMAQLAAVKVAQLIEGLLFVGTYNSNAYTFGGGSIYGYMNHPYTLTGSLTYNWDNASATGETILDDVLAMKQALIDDKHYGPFVVYIANNYETAIDQDFKSNSDITVRQRLLEVSGISDIKVADFLTDDYVLMVQMTPDVVRLINGMDIQTLQWDSYGGMQLNFKVMCIKVPQIRSTQEGDAGVALYT